MPDRPAYTFGDDERAAQRLELVAAVFEAPTTAFLAADVGATCPRLALDLGCGPGHSTRLLATITGAARTIGLDRSPRFLDDARASAPTGVEFIEHDVMTPLPVGPADLAYCRLLLAHLPDPEPTVKTWVTQLVPGGLFAAEEVEYIEAEHPVLAGYVEIVVALVASRGAAMYAGPILDAMDVEPDAHRRSNRLAVHPVSVGDAASMFALNLSTWRDDPFIQASYTENELDTLLGDLRDLARLGTRSTVEWGLRQVVFERA